MWYKGLLAEGAYIPRLIILPSKNKLQNGDTGYQIEQEDIKKYDTIENALCIRFWNRYKHLGLPRPWLTMTPQQISVIELFDSLVAKLNKELNPDGRDR